MRQYLSVTNFLVSIKKMHSKEQSWTPFYVCQVFCWTLKTCNINNTDHTKTLKFQFQIKSNATWHGPKVFFIYHSTLHFMKNTSHLFIFNKQLIIFVVLTKTCKPFSHHQQTFSEHFVYQRVVVNFHQFMAASLNQHLSLMFFFSPLHVLKYTIMYTAHCDNNTNF